MRTPVATKTFGALTHGGSKFRVNPYPFAPFGGPGPPPGGGLPPDLGGLGGILPSQSRTLIWKYWSILALLGAWGGPFWAPGPPPGGAYPPPLGGFWGPFLAPDPPPGGATPPGGGFLTPLGGLFWPPDPPPGGGQTPPGGVILAPKPPSEAKNPQKGPKIPV